jgi:hypothetical protein
MKLALIALSVIVLVCLPALARLDETPAQCQERYGAPVREIAGANGVPMVRVYHKQGMEIMAIFVGLSTNNAHVGMIFYSNIGSLVPDIRTGSLKPEEETPLLGTVPGKWEPYTPPLTLKSNAGGIPMTPVPTQIEKRRDECKTIVQTFFKTIYPLSSCSSSIDIGHMGNTRFAFRIPAGVAIAAYDDLPAIQKWHAEYQRQKTEATHPPKKDLSGF